MIAERARGATLLWITRSWSGRALLVFAILGVYLSNGRLVGSFDNIPLRYLPLSILREWNFDLNEFSFLHANNAILYPLQYHDGRFLPFAPIGPALLALPFYVIPALAGISAESPWLPQLEKLAAAGIAALSALFVLLSLARVLPGWRALLAAGLYAFGTATFGVSSQSLWPVGSAQLLLALGLYLLVRGLTDPRWTAFAALPLAGAVLCRPSAALIGLIMALYVLRHRRRQLWMFSLLALPPAAAQIAYNIVYFGTPLLPPGYVSAGGHVLARLENFSTPLWKGLAGLLASPTVGFFVYSPVFLFGLIGIYRRWRARDVLAPYLTAAILVVILLESKLNMWWGGTVLGPRYVVEISPLLAYFVAFGLPSCEVAWKRLLVGLLTAWSVYANGLIAFAFDGTWDHRATLWSWSNSPIIYYSHHTLDLLRSLGPAVSRRIQRVPDSRSRSGLSAELQLPPLPPEIATNALLEMTVRVKNSGEAAWLRLTPDSVGTVRLGWQWHRAGQTGATAEGRGFRLATDVLPGRRATIAVKIPAPLEPGPYELELGMVSEGVTWFGRDGGPPPRVAIRVTGESLCQFERALEHMRDPTEEAFHLKWVTDRTVLGPGDVLSARLNIANPGPPRVLYPVIVLRGPAGQYSFFDFEHQAFRGFCSGWIERAPAMFLDHGYRAVEVPILSLLLAKMPAGPYALYFVYLKPKESTFRLVASTALTFERLP